MSNQRVQSYPSNTLWILQNRIQQPVAANGTLLSYQQSAAVVNSPVSYQQTGYLAASPSYQHNPIAYAHTFYQYPQIVRPLPQVQYSRALLFQPQQSSTTGNLNPPRENQTRTDGTCPDSPEPPVVPAQQRRTIPRPESHPEITTAIRFFVINDVNCIIGKQSAFSLSRLLFLAHASPTTICLV
jgi:hypothetical protein